MKIRILTGHYSPEIHPRAFRAELLGKEFTKQGDDVEIIALRKIKDFNYENYTKEFKIKVKNIGLYSGNLKSHSNSKTLNSLKRTTDYFLNGRLFLNAYRIYKYIKNLPSVDIFISCSTPFMNHLGSYFLIRDAKKSRTKYFADCGDPLYYNKQSPKAIYFKYIEKIVLREFNYVLVPSKDCIKAYDAFVSVDKLKISPQGYDFSNLKEFTYKKNNPVTFAYAGAFYNDIRNPNFFLSYLCGVAKEFKFVIYYRNVDEKMYDLLKKYKIILKEKLVIHQNIPRQLLVEKLSKMDFLINMDNIVDYQIPSKLIDYCASGRPVYNCSANNFNKQTFVNFMNYNFQEELKIDKKLFDIKNIVSEMKNFN